MKFNFKNILFSIIIFSTFLSADAISFSMPSISIGTKDTTTIRCSGSCATYSYNSYYGSSYNYCPSGYSCVQPYWGNAYCSQSSCGSISCNGETSYKYCNGWGSCFSNDYDMDGDGYYTFCGDCDNNNSDVHPGAVEICDGISDNNCDGVDGEVLACCGTQDSLDLTLEGISTDALTIYVKDKVEDKIIIDGICTTQYYVDKCKETDTSILIEYQANEYDYTSQEIECTKSCEYATNGASIDFKKFSKVNYLEATCLDGACVNTEFKDTCDETTQELTEYYCEGTELKNIKKDCDDYDGYYDNEETGEKEYIEYSCQTGVCRPEVQGLTSELNPGEVNVKIVNTGSLDFIGKLTLQTEDFCKNPNNKILLEKDVHLLVDEEKIETFDFLEECTPVDYDFNCKTENYYSCSFSNEYVEQEGSCGIFDFLRKSFSHCDTCCGQRVENEDNCLSQTNICKGTPISATLTSVEGVLQNSVATVGNWCCK